MSSHMNFRRSLLAAATVALAAALAPHSDLMAQGYGGSLVVSDGQVLVGEPGGGPLPGVVYVYGAAADGWAETARLALTEVGDPPDAFGRALAGGGDLVLVGAPGWDGGRGAVVAYRYDPAAGWAEVGRLAPEILGEDAGFGSAVAVDGDVAVISAPGEGDGAGAVYVFTRTGDGWSAGTRFEPAEAGTGFGNGVAVGGTSVLVTTARTREAPAEVHSLRLDRATGSLEHLGRVEPNGELGDESGFGGSLMVKGSLALVGAPSANGTGAVVLFERDEETGALTPSGTLRPFDAEQPSGFGSALAFDGDDLWVGALSANRGNGGVYRFTSDGDGGWTGAVKVGRDGIGERASFGSALALAGDVAVVGASGVDGRAGGMVIAQRDAAGAWSDGNLVIGDHRGLPAIVGRDDDVECADNDAAGFECDNVNIISFLPINQLAGGRGARVNDLWGWTDPETKHEIAIVGRTDGTSFVDLTDPYNPVLLGNLPKTPGSRSAIWRDMKVYGDHVYIVADGAGQHGVQVFDLTRLRGVDGEAVTFEPDFTYDGIASAHNIVINERTPFAYVVGSSGGGETCGGGLHMLDLADPKRPAFAGCFAHAETGRRGTGYSHDAQCVIYHGPDEEHRGKEICLGSNENALSIADVSDKDNPVAIAVSTYPNVAYAHQGWLTEDHRFFYMNDEGDEPRGLVEGTRTLIWDLEDLDDPQLVNEYIAETTDTDHNLYIKGNLMYQSNYGAGIRILDITDPVNPVEIAFFDNSPYGGASWSNYPYFASGVVVATGTGDGLFILRNTARRTLIP
ncbi:MAG: choice-of-anchor B family protein [Gemmatimonadota bacterium]|nr:choice-of-anchor B family protein [Gemmatimonadota bacterium]